MMMSMVESDHVGFLHHIMGNWAIRKSDGSWETPSAEEAIRAVGMQSVATYIGRLQENLSRCVKTYSSIGGECQC